MADYAKKTVAELVEILKSRGLPSSGKKADLISRLNENDKEAAAPEEAPAAPEEPAPAPAAATEPTEPVPATEPTDPTSTTTATAAPTAAESTDQPSPDTTLAAQTNYSLNLPTSTLDTELAKRKARAERFGTGAATTSEPANGDATTSTADTAAETTSATETNASALKNLERAKRFGTGETAISKLDEALPSDAARGSRKRGHAQVAEASELDDPGLKRSFMSRGRGGRGGRAGGRPQQRGGGGGSGGRGGPAAAATGAKPQGVQKAPAFTSDKDRMAAEARKKKFSTA